MTEHILALDFGGTKLAAALAARGEQAWLARGQRARVPGSGAAEDWTAMCRLAHELLEEHPGRLIGVGASFGGPVDAERGIVRLSPHVRDWENTPLRAWLEAEFAAPACIDNDANAGALGEWRYGAGQGCESLLYVTVSTGIGGGWVLGGRVYSGADGLAGELGHMRVREGGPRCSCGRNGCLEALASGPAIARRARERLKAEPAAGAALRAIAPDSARLTAEQVALAAAQGDALARSVLSAAARDLGTAIGNAIALMNPQRVVLGGGVTNAGEAYWADVRRAASEVPIGGAKVDIVPAHFGADAPLWGALAMVL